MAEQKFREPLLMAAAGKKGVGKSYQTELLIQQYIKGTAHVRPRKVLILDVNDEYRQYKSISIKDVMKFSAHPIVEARRIRPMNEMSGARFTLKDIQEVLYYVLDYFKGGLLVIEDINRYVSDNLPNDLIGAICTNRHADLDIIMHFQGIGRLTPKIWQNLNYLRFHKNNESVKRHQTKFPDKFEILQIAENIVNNEYRGGNERYFLYVDTENACIRGDVTRDMADESISEYLSTNGKQAISDLVSQLDTKGNLKFSTPGEAMAYKRQELLDDYFDFGGTKKSVKDKKEEKTFGQEFPATKDKPAKK